jgi:hypothetical protein
MDLVFSSGIGKYDKEKVNKTKFQAGYFHR